MEERMMCLDIPQMDVFTEDYSSVFSVIEDAARKENGLLELRSSWEILFSAYDDDPREIPDIPEVANWIRKSVSAGVPWLYLLRQEKEPACSLTLFVIICCGEISEDPPGVYIDREQFRQFVDQNFENLEAFVSRYDMPEDLVGQTANDAVECILETFFGKRDDDGAEENGQASVDAEEESGQAFGGAEETGGRQRSDRASRRTASGSMDEADRAALRNKQTAEAIRRLTALEGMYLLNPNIKKYFSEGRLYYSYLTGGGYIGSIDTISYDKRYEAIVKKFEAETSALVYHAVEHRNTLSLFFVSPSISQWEREQPQKEGVLAQVFDLDTGESRQGYIKLDVLQCAFYRRDSRVYSDPGTDRSPDEGLDPQDVEIIRRLNILKKQGMTSDLDVIDLYQRRREICLSRLEMVFGYPVGVILRSSQAEKYEKLIVQMKEQFSLTPYFAMVTNLDEFRVMAVLFLSPDPDDWEEERDALGDKEPYAVVLDFEHMSLDVKRIEYTFCNGGPVYLPD